jgi:hypothetical protein
MDGAAAGLSTWFLQHCCEQGVSMSLPRLRGSLRRAFNPSCIAAAAVLAGASAGPAHALVSWDEVTFYLTYASFTPGESVSTTFNFGTQPAIDLRSFDFSLSWNTALAAPVSSGPGSVAAWAEQLAAKGPMSYGFAGPQTIQGSWAADAAGGAANLFSTSYSNMARAVFTFETSAALNVPFTVTVELSNLRDSDGDLVDVGSGFVNWAVMSPVPEPASWLGLVCGLALLGHVSRSKQRH